MTATALPLAPGAHSLLRTSLWFDAASVAGLGLLLVVFAAPLMPLLGLGASFMRTVGMLLLPFAAFLALTASRPRPSRVAVGWIVALNAVYVAASLLALWLGWLQPTAIGTAFVIVQALVGGAVAVAEYAGLKREARPVG